MSWEDEEEEGEGSGGSRPSRFVFFMLRSKVPFSSTSMSDSCKEQRGDQRKPAELFSAFILLFADARWEDMSWDEAVYKRAPGLNKTCKSET